MSKPMIGIKIADGSFYPILEEGVPGEKKLQVTTSRDDQTTVQINLYRSETGKIEDADYVDTLLIDNLIPHGKKEPTIDLIVKIDENNTLSARIEDQETGTESDTTASLEELGTKSIFDDAEYPMPELVSEIAGSEDNTDDLAETGTDDFLGDTFDSIPDIDFDDTESPIPEPVPENDISEDIIGEPSEMDSDDLLGDTLDSIPDIDFDDLTESLSDGNLDIGADIGTESVSDAFDFDGMDLDIPLESVINEEAVTVEDDIAMQADVPEVQTDSEETAAEHEILPEMSEIPEGEPTQMEQPSVIEKEPAAETTETSVETMEDFSFDTSELDEPIIEEAAPEIGEIDMPTEDSFSFDTEELDLPVAEDSEPAVEEEPAEDDMFSFDTAELDDAPVEEAAPTLGDDFSFDSMDLNLPVSEEVPSEENSEESPEDDDFSFTMDDYQEPVAESVLTDDDFSFSPEAEDVEDEDEPFSFDSLPDFDEIPELNVGSEDVSGFDTEMDFNIPDELSEDKGSTENVRNSGYNPYGRESEYEYAPSGGAQNALFGGSELFEETRIEEKRNKRRLVLPIVICILCALISLGALFTMLYFTPSIMKMMENLNKSGETQAVEMSDNAPIEAEDEIIINKEQERPVEENAIVVMKETVPPVVPENKGQVTKTNGIIRHLVKWGDTLWDLAGFYYRNPWLYKIISDANNLKNPDLIISGTYLQIPEQ